MKTLNQRGAAHVVVIAVVVLVVVGGVGFYVFNNKGSNSSQNSSSKPATSSSSAASSSNSSSAINAEKDKEAAKAASKAHFALVYQNKLQEAYDSTCQQFKDLTSYSVYQTSLSKPGYRAIDLSAVEYTTADVRNNQAKLSGDAGPLSENSVLDVSLLKKSGKWCVYGFEVN